MQTSPYLAQVILLLLSGYLYRRAARLKETLPLINILISQDVLFGSYRTNNPKGIAPKLIISSKYDEPRKVLEDKLNETITAFDIKAAQT